MAKLIKIYTKLFFLVIWQLVFAITILAQPPSERVLNSSFEEGEEQQAPPWMLEGLNGDKPVVVTQPALASRGKRFLSLGNKANTVHMASQIVNIPLTNKPPVKFNFFLQISTIEPKGAKESQDLLAVSISDMQGNILELLAIYGNKDRKKFARYRQQEFNLSRFIGQTIRLEFMAANSQLFPTTFRIDNVSLASADFAISAQPNTITVAKGTKGIIFIDIDRVADFTEEIEILPPNKSELKPLHLSINPLSIMTKANQVSFTVKIAPNAISDSYKFTFTAKDNKNRIRTTTVTIIVL